MVTCARSPLIDRAKTKAMSKHKARNHLRTVRRSWGLTQPELAKLCDNLSRSKIQRMERDDTQPSGHFVIACYVLFGVPIEQLFGTLFEEVETETLRRAKEFYDELDAAPTDRNGHKQKLLDQAMARALERASVTPRV